MTVRLDSKFSEQINTCEFRKAVNLAYGQGGLKLEINIPPQHILAKSKGGLIIEGGVSSSEYGIKSCTDTIAVQISIVHEKDDLVPVARPGMYTQQCSI